jgi:TP901 family phage tail tape measure protein|nr:MAG TPA: minor tail protein [Caudoviricetes sp.]
MASSKELELAVKIAGKLDASYGNALSGAAKQANAWSKTAQKAAQIATAAFAAVGTATAAATVASVKNAISYESSMADVAKVVDGLKDDNGELTAQYYEMSDALLELSTRIPMTAEELTQIAAAAGQSGIARKEIVGFAEDAAKMGVAFDTTADQAGTWMAQWRTAFKMNQKEVTTLADQINYLGNVSGANALQLSGIVTAVGSLGDVGGLSAAQIAAIGDTMASVGVGEDVAATGIAKMITTMTAGSAATEKQSKVLKKLGIDATDLADRMQTDAQGAIIDFMEALQKLPKAEQAAALKNYFGQESIKPISALYTNLDELKKHFDQVADAGLYAGSMEDEYASRSATTENSIQLAKNALMRLSITYGQMFAPYVKLAADKVTEFLNKLTEMKPQMEAAFGWIMSHGKEIAATIGGIATALGGVAVASKAKGAIDIGKQLLGLGGNDAAGKGATKKIKTSLVQQITDIAATASQTWKQTRELAAVDGAGPLALLGTLPGAALSSAADTKPAQAVTGYIARVKESFAGLNLGNLGNEDGLVQRVTKHIGGQLQTGIQAISESAPAQALQQKISSIVQMGAGAIGKAQNIAGKITGGIGGAIGKGIGALSGAAGNLVTGTIGSGGLDLISAVGGNIASLTSRLPAAANLIGTAFGPLTGIFGSILSSALPIVAVVSSIIAVISIMGDHLDDVRAAIGNVFGEQGLAVFDGAKTAIQNVGDTIAQAFSPEKLATVRSAITGMFGEGGGAAFDGVVQIVQSVVGVLGQLVAFSTTYVKPIITEIFSFVTQTVLPGIMQAFSTAAPYISQIVSGLGSVILQVATMIAQAIQAALPVVMAVIQGVLAAFQVAVPVILSVVQSLVASFQAIVASIQGVFDGLIAFVTGVFTGNWSQAWEGVKQIFGNAFNALVELAKVPINAVIALINGAIDGINSLTGGGISIPDWVPVAGGQTFSLKLNKIPALAHGGFTQGVSIAGEAGTEAVISFMPTVRSANINTWQQAGRMLGVNQQQAAAVAGAAQPAASASSVVVIPAAVQSLMQQYAGATQGEALAFADRQVEMATADPLPLALTGDGSNPGTDTEPTDGDDRPHSAPQTGGSSNGNGGAVYQYAPQFIFQGSASREDVETANKMGMTEFRRMMEQYEKDNSRRRF